MTTGFYTYELQLNENDESLGKVTYEFCKWRIGDIELYERNKTVTREESVKQ